METFFKNISDHVSFVGICVCVCVRVDWAEFQQGELSLGPHQAPYWGIGRKKSASEASAFA